MIKFKVPDQVKFSDVYVRIASWFGCGFLSPAPGTWGSLGAIPFGVAIYAGGGQTALILCVIMITVIGLWAAHKFDHAMDGHDSKMIVIDEVAGQWIALIPAALNPLYILIAFIAFRVFDIAKPWPISFIDKNVKGALGVMGDDIVAGLLAALVVIGLSAYV